MQCLYSIHTSAVSEWWLSRLASNISITALQSVLSSSTLLLTPLWLADLNSMEKVLEWAVYPTLQMVMIVAEEIGSDGTHGSEGPLYLDSDNQNETPLSVIYFILKKIYKNR